MSTNRRFVGKSWVLFVVVALALLGLTGCKKKVGDKCKPGNEYCVGTDALFCGADGTLKAMPCHGPKACKAAVGKVSCDTSNAVLGEGCNYTPDSFECTGDKKAVAVCKNEQWVAESTCKGVKGCRASTDGISCDSSTADAADECHTNGNYACTPAKDTLLQCADNKFAPLAGCRGPAGCSSREDIATNMRNFRCDTTLGQENDTCELAEDFTCAVDKKSVLVCRGNKWTVHKACSTPCLIDAKNSVSCNGVAIGNKGGGDHNASAAAVSKGSGGTTATGAKDAGAPSSGGVDAGTAAKPADAGAGVASGAADAGAKGGADAGAKAATKDAGAPKRR